MFVFNLKLNGNRLFKIIMSIFLIIVLIICGFIVYKLISSSNNSNKEIINITSSNYTDVLQSVHNDIDTYIGQNIKFSGYVYRIYDFDENQFVLARNMIISSNFQTVVVGFLCKCPEIKAYSDDTWVEIEGKITKGDYHGDIPIIEVTSIKNIQKPSDEYVYPPDDTYVPTSSLVFSY